MTDQSLGKIFKNFKNHLKIFFKLQKLKTLLIWWLDQYGIVPKLRGEREIARGKRESQKKSKNEGNSPCHLFLL